MLCNITSIAHNHQTDIPLFLLNLKGVDPSKVGDVFVGNVIQSSLDACYLARHVGLRAGVPIATPAMTINRLCGSGFETVILGAESIILGNSKIALAGGTENMSAAPMVIDGVTARWTPPALGVGLQAKDALWAGLTDSLQKCPMGITAEKLGNQYGITREDCDNYALRSQNLFEEASNKGVFKGEIAPMEVRELCKRGLCCMFKGAIPLFCCCHIPH